MLEIKVPEGYEAIMEQIMDAVSIPVTQENFHDTLNALVDVVHRGAPQGLNVSVCTFSAEGCKEQPMAMPNNTKIKIALQQENNALMVSDNNGAVFCLNYITMGDKEYLQFLSPDAAATMAKKQRALMDQVHAPEELTTFEWICNVLSELILRHPTEAAVRLEAYRNFYENMQKNTTQLEAMTQTRMADNYDTHRQHHFNSYEEAKKQEEEERQRQEQELQERLERERRENEERIRREKEERRRQAQFDMLDRSYVDEDLDDEEVRVSVTSISSQSVVMFENEVSEEELRLKQVSHFLALLELKEQELKMLPAKIAPYIKDIDLANKTIEEISRRLGPNKAKEGAMETQISDLNKKINSDYTKATFLNAKYWNLREQEDSEKNILQTQDIAPVNQIEQEMNNAKLLLDEMEKKWQEVQHDYEDMQVEPRAYIERYYQKGKETREKQYNDQLQSKNAEIKNHEDNARDYGIQIKKLDKKKDAQKIEELKQKQRDEETAVRVLKEKCVQLKKKYDENEKLVKAEALDYSQEKLDEMAAFMEKSLENYHIIKSQYDAAKRNVIAMTQAYQQQMQIYQDKKQEFDQKWDKLHTEMDDMVTQLEQLRTQQIEDKKKLGVLENEYNELKTKNEKDFSNINFLKDQRQIYEKMCKILQDSEPEIRTAIAEAKEGLRQLGEPIPGEENQMKKSGPEKIM